MAVIKCTRCGKGVSSEVPNDTIVRAFVECPECCEKQEEKEARIMNWKLVIGLITLGSGLTGAFYMFIF